VVLAANPGLVITHVSGYGQSGHPDYLGRASYDASQEIRNRHLTRDEAVALVRRFDGEAPKRYLHDVLDYIGMETERFFELCDTFRSPHLWTNDGGQWRLRHPVWEDPDA